MDLVEFIEANREKINTDARNNMLQMKLDYISSKTSDNNEYGYEDWFDEDIWDEHYKEN